MNVTNNYYSKTRQIILAISDIINVPTPKPAYVSQCLLTDTQIVEYIFSPVVEPSRSAINIYNSKKKFNRQFND